MAKREIMATASVQRDEIVSKIKELDELIGQFFGQFEKATKGQQSMGDSSCTFVDNCIKKLEMYPEILSGTFNKEDFNVKNGAVTDFFAFKQKIAETVAKLETNAKICKTDAMYYANEYYGIIQKEAVRNTKYKPTLDELTPFYKRSNKTDKTDDTKTKTVKATNDN